MRGVSRSSGAQGAGDPARRKRGMRDGEIFPGLNVHAEGAVRIRGLRDFWRGVQCRIAESASLESWDRGGAA